MSDAAGAHATVVKLTRVALLAPLVALAAMSISRLHPVPSQSGTSRVPVLPGFILAFLALVGANSVVTGELPDYCVAVGSPARIIKQYSQKDGWIKLDREI